MFTWDYYLYQRELRGEPKVELKPLVLPKFINTMVSSIAMIGKFFKRK